VQVPGLKAARERALLTQVELATRAETSALTISRLETGRQAARFATIRKLAQALDVEPGVLLGRHNPEASPT
jgi:transcriptional regulator with XRE-family HTH domain